MTSCAYIHCKPNGVPFYVGKSSTPRRHAVANKRNEYYQRVVAKVGAENVLVGTIPCSTEKIAFELEIGLIKCLRRSGVALTNITAGGEGSLGRVTSLETKKKLREANLGKTYSEETRAKLSAMRVGTKRSDATKDKMRESALKKAPMSAETKAKMSEAAKSRKVSEETRKRQSASRKGIPKSSEHAAKIGASNRKRWAEKRACS